MGKNFKMDDGYLDSMGSFLKNNSKILDDSYDAYLSCLSKITSKAIMQGDMHNKLVTFSSYAKKLKDKIEPIGSAGEKICKTFKDDISAADTFNFYEQYGGK